MTLRNSLSAFRHEENSYRRKHQLQIFNNTLLVDVHEIPLVLVMGICGLFAVDMSITNQSCIDLKLEDKSIHGFFILFDDFLQFGSMPYHRYVAYQNIEQLRKLVKRK